MRVRAHTRMLPRARGRHVVNMPQVRARTVRVRVCVVQKSPLPHCSTAACCVGCCCLHVCAYGPSCARHAVVRTCACARSAAGPCRLHLHHWEHNGTVIIAMGCCCTGLAEAVRARLASSSAIAAQAAPCAVARCTLRPARAPAVCAAFHSCVQCTPHPHSQSTMGFSEEVHASRVHAALSHARAASRARRQGQAPPPKGAHAGPAAFTAALCMVAGGLLWRQCSALVQAHGGGWSQWPLVRQFHALVTGSLRTSAPRPPRARPRTGAATVGAKVRAAHTTWPRTHARTPHGHAHTQHTCRMCTQGASKPASAAAAAGAAAIARSPSNTTFLPLPPDTDVAGEVEAAQTGAKRKKKKNKKKK